MERFNDFIKKSQETCSDAILLWLDYIFRYGNIEKALHARAEYKLWFGQNHGFRETRKIIETYFKKGVPVSARFIISN